MSHTSTRILRSVVASTLVAAAAATAPIAQAQQQASSAARPPDKPPIAQGWIDIATFASPGGMGAMAGMMMGVAAAIRRCPPSSAGKRRATSSA